jgi:hypothetical protein
MSTTYQPAYGKLRNDTSGTGPSVALWKKFNQNTLGIDGNADGRDLYETFGNWGGLVSSNVGYYPGEGGGAYKSYEDTGGTISLRDASPTTMRITTDGTDNDSMSIQGAGSLGRQAVVTTTAGSMRQVIFEGRAAVGKITDTYNWVMGLAEPACAANDGYFSDAGAVGDKDFIGFWVTEADGDSIKYGYKKAGQTLQTLGVAQVPVADTFYKLGFIYDPTAPDSKKIKFFVNGVELTTYVTATLLAAATFPNGEGLSLFTEVKNGSAAISYADYRFWRLAQSAIVA